MTKEEIEALTAEPEPEVDEADAAAEEEAPEEKSAE